MRARLVIATLLGAVALFVSATPALADERPGGNGGAYVNPDGDPTAVAGDGSSGAASGGGSAGHNPCEWRVVIDDDFKFPVYDVDSPEPQHSSTGRWLDYRCDGLGAVAVDGYFLIPEGGLVDPRQLAVDALASVGIQPPGIRTSPSANGRLYVQVPTWFWRARCQPRSRAVIATARTAIVKDARTASVVPDLSPGAAVVAPVRDRASRDLSIDEIQRTSCKATVGSSVNPRYRAGFSSSL